MNNRWAALVPLLACLSAGPTSSAVPNRRGTDLERIVHGQNAPLGQLPYQVSLQINSYPFCGGTMINKDYVVTAAHCAIDHVASNLRVVGGGVSLSDKSNQVFLVEKIVTHEYDRKTKTGDIALLKVRPLDGSQQRGDHHAKPIQLAPKDFEVKDKQCVVSGWGLLSSGSSSAPDVLQMVEVDMMPSEKCAESLKGYPYDGKAMICAGGGDRDACQGDSGGPLVCTDSVGDRYLTGIVSWGIGCATPGIPGVYTKVSSYLDWIDSQMKDIE